MLKMPGEGGWIGQSLSSSEAFNKYAESWGGVARGAEFSMTMLRLHQEYGLWILMWENLAKSRGPNKLGQAFDTQFGFVENDEPDAFADFVDGSHYCGINTGFVRVAFYLADQVVLLRDVYPGLGGDAIDAATGELALCPTPEQLGESEELFEQSLVRSHVKRLMARDCFAHLLIAFSVYHEFNHAISGHSAFVTQKLGLSRLHEQGSVAEAGLSTELHREIEYTADIGAIETLFDYAQRRTALSRLYRHIPSKRMLHRMCLLVLPVLCAQWTLLSRRFGEDGFHPNPAARLATFLRLYESFLCGHYHFGTWRLITKPAAKDLRRVAINCPELVETALSLKNYLQDSEYWAQRSPANVIIKREEISDFSFPPLVPRKPYRNRQLEKMISSAG
jgi:hypothetical protein